MNFGSADEQKSKAWKDIWGSGQGIGAVKSVLTTGELINRLRQEYLDAREKLAAVAAQY